MRSGYDHDQECYDFCASSGTNDPRTSIEERYHSRDRYLALVSGAARDLVQQGYLLEDDVATLVTLADGHWSHLFANGEASATQGGQR